MNWMITRRHAVRGLIGVAAALATGEVRPARAGTPVLQTVTAWQNGNPLPPSTGQIVDQSVADQVIATNQSLAQTLGYTLNGDGSWTDPATGITILQGYVTAAPFYDIPVHPLTGNPPPQQPVSGPSIDSQTALVFVWGQSIAANAGRGRYTAMNPNTWAYGGNGVYYRCSDPIPGSTGSDGSVWSRCADAAIGRPFGGGTVTKFVIRNISVGGTSINDWAPGGSQNSLLVSAAQDFLANVGQPTHLVYSQGEADVVGGSPTGAIIPGMSTTQWENQWFAMVNSGWRSHGNLTPIWTGQETICNIRDAGDANDQAVIWRTPADLIMIQAGRAKILAAQGYLGSLNLNTRPGPFLDAIDWRLRAYGDGCHFGELGLTAAGQAWAQALFP